MRNNFLMLLSFMFIISINNVVNAIGCKELKTTKKINEFMKKSYMSSPLLQKNVSLTLILDVCEGKGCKLKKKRAAEKEILRIIKFENKRRIFAEKGPNAPSCVINRGDRRFICSSCGLVSNENCRSFPSDDSTIFPGTNIDSTDFSLTSKFGKESRCSKLKNPNFFKIETKIKHESGSNEGTYDKFVGFYDKK